MNDAIQTALRGTGTALITPFAADLSIDWAALRGLIEWQIENSIDYLVVLGTTGETPTLTSEEKQELVTFVYNCVNGRVPVVVGIGGNNTVELAKVLENFPLDGATAVLSASPYYNKPSQEGIFQHYKVLAAASPKPIILYNVPGRTGRNMEAATTLRLAHETGNIAGIKEAGNSLDQSRELLAGRPRNFLLISGDDDLACKQMSMGFDGVISVASNVFPKDFSGMIDDALAGQMAESVASNEMLKRAYHLLFCENNPAGAKAFLSQMGRIQNHLRLPLVPLSQHLHAEVAAYLSAY